MAQTTIEWTDKSWNPVTGCKHVSPGCTHCYAEALAERFRGTQGHRFEQGFDITYWPGRLGEPLNWRTPSKIFVCSMSDLFQGAVKKDFIQQVFDAMQKASHHTYQLLTKHSDRLLTLSSSLPWAPHIWMGVSVENARYLKRIDDLRQTDAHLKFISFEPLLGPLPNLDLEGIDWVIVGGESGMQVRFIDLAWVRSIHEQCREQGVPFFFKQWGHKKHNPDPSDPTIDKGHPSHAKGGCQLDGAVIHEWPMILQGGPIAASTTSNGYATSPREKGQQ